MLRSGRAKPEEDYMGFEPQSYRPSPFQTQLCCCLIQVSMESCQVEAISDPNPLIYKNLVHKGMRLLCLVDIYKAYL